MIRKPAIALLTALTLYSAQTLADATITFYVMPETVACGEQGYKGKCQPLKASDSRNWQAQGYQVERHSLSEQEIILGQPLQQALGNGKQKSVVMLVEYSEPVSQQVGITRASGNKHIAERKWSHHMNKARRFIYHSRGDAFLTSAATEWQLRLGDRQLKLRTH